MEIRLVQSSDRAFWRVMDPHLGQEEFDRKVRDGRGYVLLLDGRRAGILRWNLFWDSIPFCTLLFVEEPSQSLGYGRAMMERWEADMRALGHGMLLVSTQVDETAQHFYRKLGYRDCGGLTVDIPGYAQPMELFLAKQIGGD